MLPKDLIKKIKKIHIKSGRMVNTMMAGQYRSVFRGSGIEFEEVREYSPGDEVKNIDWKVSARLGRPFIKLYREERELIIMLLVDMSSSNSFGTTGNIKKEIAAEIASILAFNAVKNNDKVGLILFTDRVEKYIPPKKGSAHVWRVIKEIFAFEPEHMGTNIKSAVSYFGRVCRKKTTAFLISDFLCTDYLHQLKVASKKHELISILLSDPGEFHLPGAGIFYMEDLESGELLCLDASDDKTKKDFEVIKKKEYAKTLDALKSADIDCVEINTSSEAAESLMKYFRYREKRIR